LVKSLVNPGNTSWSKQAIQVHGITKDKLNGKPPLEKFFLEFHNFIINLIEKNNNNVIICSHNAPFDQRFFNQSYKKYIKESHRISFNWFNTMALWKEDSTENLKLETIAKFYSISTTSAHDAGADVSILKECLKKKKFIDDQDLFKYLIKNASRNAQTIKRTTSKKKK